MSTVSRDTSRETATHLTYRCNNNRMVQLSPFDLQSPFQFCKTLLKQVRQQDAYRQTQRGGAVETIRNTPALSSRAISPSLIVCLYL